MGSYFIKTANDTRRWLAEDEEHAIEQHNNAVGDDTGGEKIIKVWLDKWDNCQSCGAHSLLEDGVCDDCLRGEISA